MGPLIHVTGFRYATSGAPEGTIPCSIMSEMRLVIWGLKDIAVKYTTVRVGGQGSARDTNMAYKTDIEIAREAQKRPIQEIGAKLGIGSDDLLPYGHDKAKVSQVLYQ